MIEIIPNFHPFIVHFPIAFATAALFFFATGKLFKEKKWAVQSLLFAHWMLWAAAIFAVVAAVFGWFAYNSVDHDEAGHQAMMLHRNWALVTVGVLLLLAGVDGWLRRFIVAAPYGFFAMLMVAWLLVISTAWHGGEVVYRHGLGVMSLPETEGEGHSHEDGVEHDDMHTHGDTQHIEEAHTHIHDDVMNKALPNKPGHTHAPGTAPHKD